MLNGCHEERKTPARGVCLYFARRNAWHIKAVAMVVCCAYLLFLAYSSITLTDVRHAEHPSALFDHFIYKYKKQYDAKEKILRRKIFLDNVAFIDARSKTLSYKIRVNEFADLTREEFKRAYLGLTAEKSDHNGRAHDGFPILGAHSPRKNPPASVDWVARGKVTSVMNQKTCGACYTFSAASAIESAVAISRGTRPVRLSNQQILDCSRQRGCVGGTMNESFDYVSKMGLCAYDAYPYTGHSGRCRSCVPSVLPGYILGYVSTGEDEFSLLSAVAQQPVSVGIDADGLFQYYSGGVFTQECGTQLNHGILVVGYGVLHGTKYWRVKNSWGLNWGLEGYGLIERGKRQAGGECGILKLGSYPVLADPRIAKHAPFSLHDEARAMGHPTRDTRSHPYASKDAPGVKDREQGTQDTTSGIQMPAPAVQASTNVHALTETAMVSDAVAGVAKTKNNDVVVTIVA